MKPNPSLIMLVGLVLATVTPASAFGQTTAPALPADTANLTGLTTPISVEFADGRKLNGSGFFYFEFGPDDPSATGYHWRPVTHIYVVTAKHLIHPKRITDLVRFVYAIRTGDGKQVAWRQMTIDQRGLARRLHLCQKDEVDVAVIDVTADLNLEMKAALEAHSQVLSFSGANSDEFPGRSPIDVQPGDDVIVIGYPNAIYDEFNKLPILKPAMLNTPMGLHFDGLDAFLIDLKYYEGSSGSLIITKPTRFGFDKEGRLQLASDRRFVFLGVYEGEWYVNRNEPVTADLGLGWYYYNIEEAIKNPALAP